MYLTSGSLNSFVILISQAIFSAVLLSASRGQPVSCCHSYRKLVESRDVYRK